MNFRYMVTELYYRKRRTLTSIFGLSIGIALLIILNALGLAYRQAARVPLKEIGADITVQRPGDVPKDLAGAVFPCSAVTIHKEELDKILKAAHANAGAAEMEVGGRRYRYIPANETVYDADLLLRVFESAGIPRAVTERRALKADAKAVDAMLEELLGGASHARALALKAELQGIARREPLSPRWDSKPIKKAKTAETAKGRKS